MRHFVTKLTLVLRGITIGLTLGVLFGDEIKTCLSRWAKKAQTYEKIPTENHAYPSRISIGEWTADWVAVAGSPTEPYAASQIICVYNLEPIRLPPVLQRRKEEVEAEQMKLEETIGRRQYHNGATVAVTKIEAYEVGGHEEHVIRVHLQRSDYYTFLATAMSLDRPFVTSNGLHTTLREEFLRNPDYSHPLREFASLFAIQMYVVTADNFLIVTKRGKNLVVYADCLAPTVNETVNLFTDVDESGTISLAKTVQRGTLSEIGIPVMEDEMCFFTVGVDERWYIYTITGLISLRSQTKDSIQAQASLGANERWEVDRMYFIPFDPENLARNMQSLSHSETWSPYGIACLLQVMVYAFGYEETEKALKRHTPT